MPALDELYLDHNGSTPVDPVVASEFSAWQAEGFANPSASHPEGQRARLAIAGARSTIAGALGADPGEVFFTSGGSESNNWALIGSAFARRTQARAFEGHLIVSPIEHKSVLRAAEHLAELGVRVTTLQVGESGAVDAADVRRALCADTFLVSVMLANNETGVIQPAAEIAEACRERGVRFHCDATAAVGKIPVDVRAIGCDLLSLSGHKLYAPKGIGVLYLRRGVELTPLIHGCGQQDGLRGGTENTAGCRALARAFERMAEGSFRPDATEALRDALWRGIRARFPRAIRNGSGPALPNTLSVAFLGCDAIALQRALGDRGISVSVGAAGSAGAPSHVLVAMGCAHERARSTLRFSFGAASTESTVEATLRALEEGSACEPTTFAEAAR